MMRLPEVYLNASNWQKLPGGVFFSRYEGDDDVLPQSLEPADIYRPVSLLPTEVFVRTSEREKRLESGLKAKELASDSWGSIFEVSGAGSQVGLVLMVAPIFIGAHVLPDMAHFLGNHDTVAYDAVVKDVYISKSIRAFSVCSYSSDNLPFELVLTTKFRWFRNRMNPKHLGFSKEEK
jgi:hypothetical protein